MLCQTSWHMNTRVCSNNHRQWNILQFSLNLWLLKTVIQIQIIYLCTSLPYKTVFPCICRVAAQLLSSPRQQGAKAWHAQSHKQVLQTLTVVRIWCMVVFLLHCLNFAGTCPAPTNHRTEEFGPGLLFQLLDLRGHKLNNYWTSDNVKGILYLGNWGVNVSKIKAGRGARFESFVAAGSAEDELVHAHPPPHSPIPVLGPPLVCWTWLWKQPHPMQHRQAASGPEHHKGRKQSLYLLPVHHTSSYSTSGPFLFDPLCDLAMLPWRSDGGFVFP